MKIKTFILAVFLSVFCTGGMLWSESYIPVVNVYIKAADGDIKELLPGTSVFSGEDFYIIIDVSAYMKSRSKTLRKIIGMKDHITARFFFRTRLRKRNVCIS